MATLFSDVAGSGSAGDANGVVGPIDRGEGECDADGCITVTGWRIGGGGGGDGGGGGGGGFGGCEGGRYQLEMPDCGGNTGGGGGPPPPPPPLDCEQADVDEHSLSQSDPAVPPIVAKLKEQYQLALTRLGALPADSKFIYPDGSSVTSAELYRLLSRTDFDLHREAVPFDPNALNTSGTYGGSIFNDGNPIIYTEVSWMQQNFTSEDAAQTFIFHEISYQTALGRADWASYRDPNSPGGATMTSTEVYAGEAFVNALGWVVRAAMNGRPTTNPNGILAQAPRYHPGSGSSGPTVAQAETTCAAP